MSILGSVMPAGFDTITQHMINAPFKVRVGLFQVTTSHHRIAVPAAETRSEWFTPNQGQVPFGAKTITPTPKSRIANMSRSASQIPFKMGKIRRVNREKRLNRQT
jgi:hypothetical protein